MSEVKDTICSKLTGGRVRIVSAGGDQERHGSERKLLFKKKKKKEVNIGCRTSSTKRLIQEIEGY